MTIIAEEALSRDVPTFLDHSPIKGRVKLTFDKPEIVQAVVVSVSPIICSLFWNLDCDLNAGVWSNREHHGKVNFC